MPASPAGLPAGGDSPFRELLETVNEATGWLSSHGAPPDRLKLAQYRRDLEELIRADETGSLPELARERASRRLATSLMEAAEIRRLYLALNFFSGSALEARLRDLLRRAGAESDEYARNASEDPRDLALEMTLAVRLAASGFEVVADHQGRFEANVGGRCVMFEGTRVHSARDVGTRIREADKRLGERCRRRPGARAVLALAITRVEGLGLDFLASPDPMQLNRWMERGTEVFFDRYAHLWARPLAGSLIGVWVYVSRPALVGITNRLTYAQRFALAPIPFLSHADGELLWLMDERFRLLAELAASSA